MASTLIIQQLDKIALDPALPGILHVFCTVNCAQNLMKPWDTKPRHEIVTCAARDGDYFIRHSLIVLCVAMKKKTHKECVFHNALLSCGALTLLRSSLVLRLLLERQMESADRMTRPLQPYTLNLYTHTANYKQMLASWRDCSCLGLAHRHAFMLTHKITNLYLQLLTGIEGGIATMSETTTASSWKRGESECVQHHKVVM